MLARSRARSGATGSSTRSVRPPPPQRRNAAEELLETTDLPVEEVARRVGYAGAAVLREQFVRRRGVPPRAYRRAFTQRRT
ncbi:helix-turn-helix domain-containing protein [Streptomyces chryseus]